MQKKKNIRSGLNFTDVAVFVICTCGIVFALKSFYTSVNMTFAKNNDKPVGMIYFKKNTAQRRFVDRNLWERLRESSPLYNGDRIRTADLSEAVAVFQDGTRIEIHENTLLQIFAYNNEAMINFESGNLSVQAAASSSAVKVNTGNQEISITPESVATVKMPSKDSAQSGVVAVLSGDVVIKDVAEKSVKPESKNAALRFISKSFDVVKERLPLSSDDQPVVDEASARTVSYGEYEQINNAENMPDASPVLVPPPTQSIIAEPGSCPVLTWFWVADKPVMLEFSRVASFTPVIATCKLQSTKGKENVTLPPVEDDKPLFWRMVSPSDTKNPVIASGVILPQQKPVISKEVVQAVFANNKDAAPVDVLATAITTSIAASPVNAVSTASVQTSFAADDLSAVQKAGSQLLGNEQRPSLVELEKRLAKTEHKNEVTTESVVVPPAKAVAKAEERKPVPVVEKVEPKKKPAKSKAPVKKVAKKSAPTKKVTPVVAKATPPVKKVVPAKENPQPKKDIPAAPVAKKTPAAVKKGNLGLPEILPVLKSPSSNFVFTENELGSGSIDFSWDSVPGTMGYVFELYKGSKCLLSKKVKTSSFALRDLSLLEPGDFTWAVRGQGMESGVEQETKIASAPFSVRITALEELEIDTSELIPSR